MKKTQRKPLHLNRETLRHLTFAQELRAVRGGGGTLTCTSCQIAGCHCINTGDPETLNTSCTCPDNQDQP